MSKKVAIIVPVYNPDRAIIRCLDSLVHQSLDDIEIICVLDCSTDGGDTICKAMAEKNKRLIIIENEKNKGVSVSRNLGIDRAIQDGVEYIGFVDSDDYVSSNMYYQLYEYAKQRECDIVRCNTVIEYPEKTVFTEFRDPTYKGIFRSLILPMDSKLNPNFLSRCCWNALYSTNIIGSTRFLGEINNGEDTLFNFMLLAKNPKIGYIKDVLYHWCQKEGSLSNIIYTHETMCNKMLTLQELEWDILSSNGINSYTQEFHVQISWLMRRFYHVIIKLDKTFIKRLSALIIKSNFPLFGRYEDMKIVSRIRILLFLFTIRLKYFT